jgi:hypothetical protein
MALQAREAIATATASASRRSAPRTSSSSLLTSRWLA